MSEGVYATFHHIAACKFKSSIELTPALSLLSCSMISRARGDAGRYRLIGRERAYHGVGFGGISVGGIVTNRRTYGPMLAGNVL